MLSLSLTHHAASCHPESRPGRVRDLLYHDLLGTARQRSPWSLLPARRTKPSIEPRRRSHAFRNRIDDLFPAIHTIARRKEFRIPGLMPLVDLHRAALVQL